MFLLESIKYENTIMHHGDYTIYHEIIVDIIALHYHQSDLSGMYNLQQKYNQLNTNCYKFNAKKWH